MKTKILSVTQIILTVSKEELLLINNALNEVCNGLDIPEFTARLGAEREEVLVILRQIQEILDRID